MQKTIWITGASSGIGREFARRYAAMGCRLILTARRADRLQALAKELHAAHGTECRIETADLSRAEECSRLCEVLADEHIDIFINNAGFGVCGSILETEEAREEEMIQVNVAAMARLFRAVVRKMHAQGGGTILNVASSAGLLPGGPRSCGRCTAPSTSAPSAPARWIPSSTTAPGWCLPCGALPRSCAWRKLCWA